MASLSALLGEKLLSKSGEVSTADALVGKKAIALYFSAHWCPPCRGFTPKLAEWYSTHLKEKGLEVVFVSSDKDESAFTEYFGGMPWLAVPYANRDVKSALDKKYKIQGIPSVIILSPEGEVITKDGRAAISNDPSGENLPWKPKSFDEIFSDATLIRQDGTNCLGSSLKGKVFGLYFSAHWCPPCRGFTPQLAEWYTKDLQGKGFEIVFVSSDRDEQSFKEYFGEQPWLALDYSDRKRKEELSNKFGVRGIPSFVVIDKDGSVITKDGRAAVTGDPTGADFPWYPKPVTNLKAGPGNINEVPTVLAFCETADAATQKSIEDALAPVATRYVEEAKAKGEEDPAVAFVIVTTSAGLSGKIRSMLQLPSLPPAAHEHALEKKESIGGWGCDGCGNSGEGKERYRCTKGCDFDLCGECNTKANSGEKVSFPPRLMLVDIPDNGGYYQGPEGEITTVIVEKFMNEYTGKSLERQQLQ